MRGEGVVPTVCHFPHCVSAPLLAGPSLESPAWSHRDCSLQSSQPWVSAFSQSFSPRVPGLTQEVIEGLCTLAFMPAHLCDL